MVAAKGLIYQNDRACLATMHGKEKVIAPLAERFLGLRLEVVTGLDTDAFGTFSRDIERSGSQLDAARAKIAAAYELMPEIQIGLASEGSFGPHPFIPFCSLAREIVVLDDRKTGLELNGHYASLDANFSHLIVSDVAAGHDFAERVGFPDQGIIVMGCRDGQPAHDIALIKDVRSSDELTLALASLVTETGSAYVETDMRAHRNLRRMRAIKRATIDLIRRARSGCPACSWPGYAVTERLPGLPCSWCSEPTLLTRAEIMSCLRCELRIERPVAATEADPANCGECNP